MLGLLRLDYVVFGWYWVSWCLNTFKKESFHYHEPPD